MGLTITLIEPFYFIGFVPNSTNPTANKHQITFPRSKNQGVPIHDI